MEVPSKRVSQVLLLRCSALLFSSMESAELFLGLNQLKHSNKPPEGFIICPDWSITEQKQTAAVPSSSTSFFSLFQTCCRHPISEGVEPTLYFGSFHQKESTISIKSWLKKCKIFMHLCDLKVSISLARSLALCQQCAKIRSEICALIVVRSHGGDLSILTGKITRRSTSVI